MVWRTRLGLVAWRGTVDGRPHAFTQLRSTYRHQADSAIGFQMFNDPGDEWCDAGEQWRADGIVRSPLGGITHPVIAWQNRPTYQRVVSFPSGRS